MLLRVFTTPIKGCLQYTRLATCPKTCASGSLHTAQMDVLSIDNTCASKAVSFWDEESIASTVIVTFALLQGLRVSSLHGKRTNEGTSLPAK
eukprot:5257214-Amphidinium_carterae.1